MSSPRSAAPLPSSSHSATATTTTPTSPTAANCEPGAFASSEPPLATPHQHVHYAPDGTHGPADIANTRIARSESALTSNLSTRAPTRRRSTRVASLKPVQDYEDFESRPGWQPGAEPGVDPAKPDGGHASRPALSAPCEIAVVDFSQECMSTQRLDNDSLVPFLKQPQPAHAKCRWINVKGLSWDVIQALGQYKKLHRLAIEDLMNTRNRTKVDWFPAHAFIVMTLQKLVHSRHSGAEDSDSADEEDDAVSWSSGRGQRAERGSLPGTGLSRRLTSVLARSKTNKLAERGIENGEYPMHPAGFQQSYAAGFGEFQNEPDPVRFRTIQRYHASANDARTVFMERHSALVEKGFSVAAEQVSIFITNDNTIISFFELSAEDVEKPIIRRLETSDTVLRQSCDASMVGQAIIDAIIDLALPVTACYSDVVADLEMDVLTRPTIHHTKRLYIITTEINKMLSFIAPITNLINALRDHKTNMTQDAAMNALQNPMEGVIITPMTYTYLGDVLDHCVLITESLTQVRSSADGMIDLIFNTISASQNESMKQLAVVSIVFLPLTFLTGYFGQNFEPFDDLGRGISFFWVIAAPVMVAMILIIMSQTIWDYAKVLIQRHHIGRLRKRRQARKKRRRA